jgi:hypothetical protein
LPLAAKPQPKANGTQSKAHLLIGHALYAEGHWLDEVSEGKLGNGAAVLWPSWAFIGADT